MELVIKRIARMGRRRRSALGASPMPVGFLLLFIAAASLLFAFISLPIVMLFGSLTYGSVMEAVRGPHLLPALALSVFTTAIAMALIVVLGTPVAYLLARCDFPLKNVVGIIIDLPIVIPPSVAGIGLLVAFGRRSPIGSALDDVGISLSFTTLAVILAQIFIAAPFYIRAAKIGFTVANQELEGMARSLGANWWSTFRKVTLPLSKPHLISGVLTCWARALGEFGATIMFAGSFLGKTETMPLAIYSAMNEDIGVAIVLANILVAMSIALMTAVKLMPVRNELS